MNRDFIFVRPATLEEARAVYREEVSKGRSAVFWGGGTELLSMARTGQLAPRVGIDLKGIPEVTLLERDRGQWLLGAGLPLNRPADQIGSSLLFDCFEGVADHTIRNRLTLGGNLCGRLPYREVMIPLLALDAGVNIFGPEGLRSEKVRRAAPKGRFNLNPGEFLVSLEVDEALLSENYFYTRSTGTGPVAYPLLSLMMLVQEGKLTLAHSGLQPVPGWGSLGFPGEDLSGWAGESAEGLVSRFRSDAAGSAEYRRVLLADALARGAEKLLKGGTK